MRAARHEAHQPAAAHEATRRRNPRPANGSPARPSRAAERFASAPLSFRPIRRSAGSVPGFRSPAGSGRRPVRRAVHGAGSETCGGRRRSRYRSAGRSPGSSPRAARTRMPVSSPKCHAIAERRNATGSSTGCSRGTSSNEKSTSGHGTNPVTVEWPVMARISRKKRALTSHSASRSPLVAAFAGP